MTTATLESDQRRKQLLAQLAAILQTEDASPSEEAAPRPDTAQDASIAELRELGLPVGQDGPPLASRVVAAQKAGRGGTPAQRLAAANEYLPLAPDEFSKFRLAEAEVESLALKFLMHRHAAAGREIAEQIGMPFGICEKLLQSLKTDRLVILKGAGSLGDYIYELTDAGTQRAGKFAEHCQYFGAAPVCLDDYAANAVHEALPILRG
jgi:hypothetical protein